MSENTTGCGRRTFLKAAGAAGSAAALGGVGSASGGGERELIVGVSAAESMEEVESRLPANARVVRRNETLGYVLARVESSGMADMVSTEATIHDIPGVRYTERNETVYALGAATEEGEGDTPDDPKFDSQYAPQLVNAPEAWETTKGENATVAIVDTGVDYEHDDLAPQFGENEGKDFAADDDDPQNEGNGEKHGSHVAGIVAGTSDNGTGIAGISDATLLSCRVLGSDGKGSLADVADGVEYAADQGVDVINMSLGGGGFQQTMKNAVSYAIEQGTLPVCAAGNSRGDPVAYPAAYEECLAVSAVDDDDDIAGFSNVGPKVDVAAPGVSVLSCVTSWLTDYGTLSGTSMACPVVSGVAALAKGVDPDLGPNELRALLKETAVDVGLSDDQQGAGRVDAAAAVLAADPTPRAEFAVSNDHPDTGETVRFDASASEVPGGEIASYRWEIGRLNNKSGEVVEHSFRIPGQRDVTLTLTSEEGNTDSKTVTLGVGSDGGECGDRVESTSLSGYVARTGDSAGRTYSQKVDNTCSLDVTLDAPDGADFDLYLTLDGRQPDEDDFDRRTGTGNGDTIHLDDSDLDTGFDLGLLVRSYQGSGEYTLTVEEEGRASPAHTMPRARITANPLTAEVGETVVLYAGSSEAPDGNIVEFEWEIGDQTATGELVEHEFASPGEYQVGLSVTDDAGFSGTTTTTVSVVSTDPDCRVEEETTEEGSLSGGLTGWRESYRYDAQLDDPCLVTVSLRGPDDADFDLVVAGGPWTTSSGPDANEQVIIEDFDSSDGFWITVLRRDGSGDYDLTVEEYGQ